MSKFEYERLLITAASAEFGPSVLALLGSLTLNWPEHPPVLVYDLGMDDFTKARLVDIGVPVRQVPPFCPHWRQHFTWKIWCTNDAPARDFLWIDAGIVVLQPLDELFQAIENMGYFLVPNYELLDYEASPAACKACGVAYDFRLGKATLAGGLLGFRKEGETAALLQEALSVALDKAAIAAATVSHRHDQAILSLLMYRYFGKAVMGDGQVYLGGLSPQQVPGQKLWVHRRAILAHDQEHFASHIALSGNPYQPSQPVSLARAQASYALYKAHWWYGIGNHREALASLQIAFQIDVSLANDVDGFIRWLSWSQNNLARFNSDPEKYFDFGFWVVNNLPAASGRSLPGKVAGWLHVQAVFICFKENRLNDARKHVILSYIADPALLRNRGLLSVLLKSFRRPLSTTGI